MKKILLHLTFKLQEIIKKQVEKMIYAGLANLFQSQDNLSIDKFLITVIESLMLLEREEYLKEQEGRQETDNGSYMRDFRSLSTNRLEIRSSILCY
ncbi:MAG: hypothetical protein AAF770_01825 [Bacteroidota bacterium]